MARQLEDTLETIRAKVLASVGRTFQGSSVSTNATLIDSFIQQAQRWLYDELNWQKLRTVWQIEVVPNTQHIEYPTIKNVNIGHHLGDCDPDKIISLQAQRADDAGDYWRPLSEGIDFIHDALDEQYTYLQRYDRFEMLELWPQVDSPNNLRIEGFPLLARLTNNDDRCTIPSRYVETEAIFRAKSHFGFRDAQVYARDTRNNIRRAREKMHGQTRYLPNNRGAVLTPRPTITNPQT